jgi:hypothetical protein
MKAAVMEAEAEAVTVCNGNRVAAVVAAAALVATKTTAATAMVGTQTTINNQLKVVAAMAMETIPKYTNTNKI